MATPKLKVLLTAGSFNQTTQMWQIAQALPPAHFEPWFTPAYADGLLDTCRRFGLLEWTILGERLSRRGMDHLRDQGARIDEGGRKQRYDLYVLCHDLIVPRNVRGGRSILVQEGMTDPEGLGFELVRRARFLPRWLASTASTGLSDCYDRFCVASEGYRELFVRKGVRPEKLVVTGIPNFDDCARYTRNTFPYRDYVLVCSSDSRETFKRHDRREFLDKVGRIAAGRPLVFKLHPNENAARAIREIAAVYPQAPVLTEGCAEEMVANCRVLIVEYSTLAYVGLALGKEVHAWEDVEILRRLLPEQHGQAALRIAGVACELMAVAPRREECVA
ncbi:MAG TPA: hypothetical protein VMG32_14665 [Anaeromyxobacteraceae bacterium]|nr:hypothetical protein [Anaeromyxobacteraceae bacterium]